MLMKKKKENWDFFHHLFIHFHHNGIGSEIFLSIFFEGFATHPPPPQIIILLFFSKKVKCKQMLWWGAFLSLFVVVVVKIVYFFSLAMATAINRLQKKNEGNFYVDKKKKIEFALIKNGESSESESLLLLLWYCFCLLHSTHSHYAHSIFYSIVWYGSYHYSPNDRNYVTQAMGNCSKVRQPIIYWKGS